MKYLALNLILMFLVTGGLKAQSAYEKIMRESIGMVINSQSSDTLHQAVNQFERIAARETDKWEPLYYAGFGYVMLANYATSNADKDKYLDQAAASVNKGLAMAPEESELVTLTGFIHMLRVTVDPATRGPEYVPQAMRSFQQAIGMEPSNPRAHFLMGQMEIGTAKFFGSDTAPGCNRIRESLDLFEAQAQDNAIAPAWGKSWALANIRSCQ